MRITWQACPHLLYTSDDEDQSGWQYLQVGCPECGQIGINVEDGTLDPRQPTWSPAGQTTDMGPGGYR